MTHTVLTRLLPRPVVSLLSWSLVLCGISVARAEIALPSIIGDHMVLQRGIAAPIWGFADPGEAVVVTIGDQKHEAVANDQGRWMVPSAAAGGG